MELAKIPRYLSTFRFTLLREMSARTSVRVYVVWHILIRFFHLRKNRQKYAMV